MHPCIILKAFFFSSFRLLCVRNLWRRHRRKIFLTVGVLGGGYFLYKLYDAHTQRLHALERELALQRESEELMKAQLSEIPTFQCFIR